MPRLKLLTLPVLLLVLGACTSVGSAICPEPPQIPASVKAEPPKSDLMQRLLTLLSPSQGTGTEQPSTPNPATTGQ